MILTTQEALPLIQSAKVFDYWQLLKPRVMSLAIFTAAVGMYIAPGHLHPFLMLVSIIAISAGAGGAGCLNMWWEAKEDVLMNRTHRRPIPSGRVSPESALGLGAFLSIGSVILLSLASNGWAAFWLAFTIIYYFIFYTIYLKPRTDQSIVIGGLSGALPPVIGYAAVTGHTSLDVWLLCGIVLAWTPAHFWALALKFAQDYKRANLPMLPNTRGVIYTRQEICVYTFMTVGVSLFPWFLGCAHDIYGFFALFLGAHFFYSSLSLFYRKIKPTQFFGISIMYLFAIFLARVIDHFIFR